MQTLSELGWMALRAVYFLLPAYFANMAPVICKNILKPLAKPIDWGAKLGDTELFGSHKTWRGLIVATVAGTLIFWIQQLMYRFPFAQQLSLFDYTAMPILLGILLGFGAILGDLVKSFLKRRTARNPGAPWFPFDQMDYPIGAMLLGSILFLPSIGVIISGIVLSVVLSLLVNYLSFRLGLKGVPF